MSHFVKNKKTFNAFIDRLVNLNFDESDSSDSDDHPTDDLMRSNTNSNNIKSDKIH